MNQEILSLRWKDFSTHLSSSISDVFTENSFSDVTLVCDDLIQFQSHKFVLSACSPVLKDLLLKNPHSHPLIYLRGIKEQELQSILQFIYLGDARFYEGNRDKFMEAVKDLQLKQLAECFMTSGIPFVNGGKYAEEDNMASMTSDQDKLANIDDENDTEHENVENIMTYNSTTPVVNLAVNCTSVRNVRQFLEVRQVCCITQELSMKALCIHVSSVNIRQNNWAI
jgi:hypothetical protein